MSNIQNLYYQSIIQRNNINVPIIVGSKFYSSPSPLTPMTKTVYQNARIIQKNLVYLIGLSPKFLDKNELLKSREYLGQYGTIKKLSFNKNKSYNNNNPNGPSYSCWILYSKPEESSLAILCLDEISFDNRTLKASFGTTKYCSNFLSGLNCTVKDCVFLHSFAEKMDVVTKEEMKADRSIFSEQHRKAIIMSRIFSLDKYSELKSKKNWNTVFPNAFSVYQCNAVKMFMKSKGVKIVCDDNINQTPIKPLSTPIQEKKNDNTEEFVKISDIVNSNNEGSIEEKDSSKENDIESNLMNNSEENDIENDTRKKKKFFGSLDCFRTKEKSTYDLDNKEVKNNIEIPIEISYILQREIRESIYKKREDQNNQNINDYINKSYDDVYSKNWSDLLGVFNMWKKINITNKSPAQINDCIIFDNEKIKHNSY